MGVACLTITTALYLLTAYAFGRKLDLPHCVIYVGYSVANVGWLWYAWKGGI